MSPLHPSDSRLLRWADGIEAKRLERHLTRCSRCGARMEQLTALPPAVLRKLQDELTPESGFADRMDATLRTRILNHETMALFGELFGIGPLTARLLLEKDGRDG
jgi:hypothetical protein